MLINSKTHITEHLQPFTPLCFCINLHHQKSGHKCKHLFLAVVQTAINWTTLHIENYKNISYASA